MLRTFICPRCLLQHQGHVDEKLHVSLCHHFPSTYGIGYLICTDCLQTALEKIMHL